jgi:hypothetical protein
MKKKLADNLSAGVSVFVHVYIVGSIKPENAIIRMACRAHNLRLNIILELTVKRFIFR